MKHWLIYEHKLRTSTTIIHNVTHNINNSCVLKPLQLQPFNGLFSRTTGVSRYQKGKTNLDFTGARDSEWQWHQLGHMQVCIWLQTDNHASTPPLSFLQAGCPSCCPTNSVKALKALHKIIHMTIFVVLSSWLRATKRVHPRFTWWMQTQRQMAANPQTKSNNTGCESTCQLLPPTSNTALLLLLSQSRYSFYHPTEGGRLSWSRYCSKGVQPVPKSR